MTKIFKSSIKIHDLTQVETVFNYNLLSTLEERNTLANKQKYDVEAYFFFPPQMNINPHSYSKNDFFEDLRPLSRFIEPKLSIHDFLGTAKSKNTAFSEIEDLVKDIQNVNHKISTNKIIHKLRIFSCSLSSYISQQTEHVEKNLKKVIDSSLSLEKANTIYQNSFYILKNFYFLFNKWQIIYRYIDSKNIQQNLKLKNEICFFDENISYLLNEKIAYIAYLVSQLNKNKDSNVYFLLNRRIKAWGRFINFYLKKRKYKNLNINSTRQQKENYSMRISFLKRRMWQDLYLNISDKSSFFLKKNIAYITAAGFAALWTIFANIFIWYHLKFESYKSLLNNSGTFLGLGGTFILLSFVLVYILKDRIKDIGRDNFQTSLFNQLPDRKENILFRDYKNRHIYIGVVEEAQEYILSKKNIPKEVLDFRSYRQKGQYLEHENIIRYHKTMTLNGKKIIKLGNNITSVKDIIRFNLKRFTILLDNPEYNRSFFKTDGSFYGLKLPKVYYIDIVFSYSQQNERGEKISLGMDNIRILINKNGIVRVNQS